MLLTIKHITDDNFFFQKDSAQVHCVCNRIQLSDGWLVGWLVGVYVLFQHKYGYIRDERSGFDSYPLTQ